MGYLGYLKKARREESERDYEQSPNVLSEAGGRLVISGQSNSWTVLLRRASIRLHLVRMWQRSLLSSATDFDCCLEFNWQSCEIKACREI